MVCKGVAESGVFARVAGADVAIVPDGQLLYARRLCGSANGVLVQ